MVVDNDNAWLHRLVNCDHPVSRTPYGRQPRPVRFSVPRLTGNPHWRTAPPETDCGAVTTKLSWETAEAIVAEKRDGPARAQEDPSGEEAMKVIAALWEWAVTREREALGSA